MVQQLSLVATLPHSQYVQTMATLQALTGIQSPKDISTYTLLTKPYPEFKPKLEPGKINQIEQYFMKCITTWDGATSEDLDISKPIIDGEGNGEIWVDTLFAGGDSGEKRNWTLQISDIPTAGKNQTCSAQTIYESTLVHHHTPIRQQPEPPKVDRALSSTQEQPKEENTTEKSEVKSEKEGDGDVMEIDDAAPIAAALVDPPLDSFLQFLQDLGYEVKNQYWIKGVRYFYKDIFIDTFKVFIRDDDFESQNSKLKLKLLDSTNTFQVKVYVNVPRATDVELINQNTKSLLKFQELIRSLINLETPDRMYMDSRVIKS